MADQQHGTTDALTDRLASILAFVDGHVRFAEGKNGALLAFNGATLIALLQSVPHSSSLGTWAIRYLWLLGLGSAISAAIAMLSFLPVMRMPWLARPPKDRPAPNLLFFADVRTLNGDSLVKELSSAMDSVTIAQPALSRMYADQIIVNSRIATRKFAYFQSALWITLCGFATPLVGLFLYLWSSDRD